MQQLIKQPPSGGCVLKPLTKLNGSLSKAQPPSGGCVLKLLQTVISSHSASAAAFGRLCVETDSNLTQI